MDSPLFRPVTSCSDRGQSGVPVLLPDWVLLVVQQGYNETFFEWLRRVAVQTFLIELVDSAVAVSDTYVQIVSPLVVTVIETPIRSYFTIVK